MRYLTGATATLANLAIRNLIALALGLALGLGLWFATAPVANAARDMTAAEMLQSKLPRNKNLNTANKTEMLDAVCGAVARWSPHAPQIVRTAVTAHHEYAGDIVTTAVRCLRDAKEGPLDCERIIELYRVAVDGDPNDQAIILESVLWIAPDCHGIVAPPAEGPSDFGQFSNAQSNINPPSGTIGGGGFNPSVNSCLVCHNGSEIQMACDQVNKFLRQHPGDHAGACQVTPNTNR